MWPVRGVLPVFRPLIGMLLLLLPLLMPMPMWPKDGRRKWKGGQQ